MSRLFLPPRHGVSEYYRSMAIGYLARQLGTREEFTLAVATISSGYFVEEIDRLIAKAEEVFEVERVNPLAIRISKAKETMLVTFKHLGSDA